MDGSNIYKTSEIYGDNSVFLGSTEIQTETPLSLNGNSSRFWEYMKKIKVLSDFPHFFF